MKYLLFWAETHILMLYNQRKDRQQSIVNYYFLPMLLILDFDIDKTHTINNWKYAMESLSFQDYGNIEMLVDRYHYIEY